MIKLTAPLDGEAVSSLRAGDNVLISGIIYTARDSAHKKMTEDMSTGGSLPFDIKNQVIYYAGPTPAKPGQVIGSCGPTTSGRVDKFTPALLDAGLKGMIGKGERSEQVKDAIIRNKCVYFAAIGGAGALISKCVKSAQVIAYPEFGTEALRKLEVEELPAVVIIDSEGNDLYEQSYGKKSQ